MTSMILKRKEKFALEKTIWWNWEIHSSDEERKGEIDRERVGETLEVSVGIKFSLENTRIYTLIKIYI